MGEIGIDISQHRSKSVDEFLGQSFDYVITFVTTPIDSGPMFPGKAERIHWSITDRLRSLAMSRSDSQHSEAHEIIYANG
jgi:protein-tyrosine-phosphatase